MITTLADLLGELARAEAEKLGKSDIKHPTLIGGMYEGLTRELLLHTVPDGLDLHVVDGLVVDGRGGTSGPNLVVAKGGSLVKLSGYPYRAPRQTNGRWPIMARSLT